MEAVKNEPLKMASVRPMQVAIKGRIENSRIYEGKRYTHVMTPAADAYSRPQLVEVRSKKKFGEKGDEVTVICALGGFARRPYKATDKETGEVSMVTPVDHTLDLIEND